MVHRFKSKYFKGHNLHTDMIFAIYFVQTVHKINNVYLQYTQNNISNAFLNLTDARRTDGVLKGNNYQVQQFTGQ
jgi:hypothetical protein